MPLMKVLMLVASQGYQSNEYTIPKKMLESSGAQVFTASDNSGTAVAHDNARTQVNYILEDVNPYDFDALIIVGGGGALEHLDKPVTHALLKKAESLNKVIGAICIAPRILAKAGILTSKKATSWDGDHKVSALFKKHDVILIKSPVVIDGNIITAEGPHAAQAFGEALIKALHLPV